VLELTRISGGNDRGNSIAVDGNGQTFVTGTTTSSSLPNALPPALSGLNAFLAVAPFAWFAADLQGITSEYCRSVPPAATRGRRSSLE